MLQIEVRAALWVSEIELRKIRGTPELDGSEVENSQPGACIDVICQSLDVCSWTASLFRPLGDLVSTWEEQKEAHRVQPGAKHYCFATCSSGSRCILLHYV